MSGAALDADELRRLLRDATSREATRRLMAVIDVVDGDAPATVAERFGLDLEAVNEWVAEFEAESPAAVVERIERFERPGRGTTPTGLDEESHLEYLDYDAVRERGWELDGDPFELARESDLDPPAYGGFTVPGGAAILEAAEAAGVEWPHACRGGACSNCAVLLEAGEISMPGSQILPDEALERGARLTCVGTPITERVQVVYNVDHLEGLEEFRLEEPP